jgi:hypothetical protein
MLARPIPTESHIFSFTVLAGLVVYAGLRRSFQYGVLLGIYVIWGHEIIWWICYGLEYSGLAYWFLFVQMGAGIYLTVRVYPALLKLSGYRMNWKLLAGMVGPYAVFAAVWLAGGLPVSNSFSATNGSILLFGSASPNFSNVWVNTIENFSWLTIAVSALVCMHYDSAPGIPFTFAPPDAPKPAKHTVWKVAFAGACVGLLILIWGHTLTGWFSSVWLDALLQGSVYGMLALSIIWFFVIALPPRRKPVVL